MKNILVCGASKGIGKATAEILAGKNRRIFLLARSKESLCEVSEKLKNTCETHALCLDINNLEELKKSISSVLKEYGPIEILVANTGGPKAGPLLEANNLDFLEAFQNHLLANLELTKLLAPGMKEKKFGRIINIISTSVKAPIPNLGVSNTMRGAVASFTKTLSYELGPFGITVNNILPGYTKTTRLETLMDNMSKKQNIAKETLIENLKKTIPARRFAEASDIAHAVSFLASDKASYINGVNLPVDGGRTNAL